MDRRDAYAHACPLYMQGGVGTCVAVSIVHANTDCFLIEVHMRTFMGNGRTCTRESNCFLAITRCRDAQFILRKIFGFLKLQTPLPTQALEKAMSRITDDFRCNEAADRHLQSSEQQKKIQSLWPDQRKREASCQNFGDNDSNKKKQKSQAHKMTLEELQSIGRVDSNRSASFDVDSELQRIRAINYQRAWTKQLLKYSDHLTLPEVADFISILPPLKPKKKQYVRKTVKKDFIPIPQVQEQQPNLKDVAPEDLQRLRDLFKAAKTQREKREFVSAFMDAETKNFSVHGKHMSWKGMRILFGVSNDFLAGIKRTPYATTRGKLIMAS